LLHVVDRALASQVLDGRGADDTDLSDGGVGGPAPGLVVARPWAERTIGRSVVINGQGLHSGIRTGLILQPLPPGSGIVFGSISSGGTVPALVDHVDSTGYATTLVRGDMVAQTVEHLLATLHAYGITN